MSLIKDSICFVRLEFYDQNNNFKVGPLIRIVDRSSIIWPRENFTVLKPGRNIPPTSEQHVQVYFSRQLQQSSLSKINGIEKGQKMLAALCVEACSILEQGSETFYSAIVKASMKKNVRYSLRMKVNNRGDIIRSECECPAGKGPHSVCKHIATLGLMLAKYNMTNQLNIKPACTEKLQTFHHPSRKHEGSVSTIEEMFPLRDTNSPCLIENSQDFTSMIRNQVLSFAWSSGKDINMKYAYEQADLKKAMFDHDYLERPYVEYWINDRLKVSAEDVANIEKATRQQSASKLWAKEREWRLTASRFGDIICATERRDLNKLCESLLSHDMLHTVATSHGMTYEAEAMKAFSAKTGLNVQKCGLFVDVDNPFLAATPDAVIGADEVLEVKCPYTGRESTILPGPLFPFLEHCDRGSRLKRSHKYYYQVQGEMACSRRTSCYFVVYTFVDIFIEKIEFDSRLFNNYMKPSLEKFYRTCWLTYLGNKVT